ncbi:RcnB family protein [Sodalis sp. RH16]|uniref:RcnB family protein n=1 Tax=unclassified Sodalis (in: enterobacteria) TaxID=2636512 RepID=UPI0039B53BF5
MKKTTLMLVLTLFASGSVFSTGSYADGRRDHDGHGPRWDRGHGHGGPGWHHDRGDFRGHGYRGGYHDRFAWRGHEFRRGYPLPPPYRGDYYRVHDWRHRGLQSPPRGHYWAYIDGRYVMVAAATGVITAIIMGNALGY